jgi:predicted O-linked N-acetylglucosamine transferase (SPINDLY family)
VNGVQVVTCRGRTISSRVAAANLTTAGLDDYIASNFDQNVELAVAKEARRRWWSFSALARPHRRHRVRRLEKRYTRAVEKLYRAMWQQWCEKNGGVFPI